MDNEQQIALDGRDELTNSSDKGEEHWGRAEELSACRQAVIAGFEGSDEEEA